MIGLRQVRLDLGVFLDLLNVVTHAAAAAWDDMTIGWSVSQQRINEEGRGLVSHVLSICLYLIWAS